MEEIECICLCMQPFVTHRSDDTDSDSGRKRRGRSGSRERRPRDRRRSRSRSRSRDGRGRRDRFSPPRGRDRENGAPAPAPAPQPPPRERAPVRSGPAGGVYIPPFKLAAMLAEVSDTSSVQYQRMTWDALRKSINGLVNKINISNIKHILPEVFSENLSRGRGLLCRSLMKSQAASPSFAPVYAALVAVVNSKFPEIGELLLQRVLLQFKRAYRRNDKPVCSAALRFLAHLINQQVAHEVLALEVATLLLESPTDDGVEMAVEFVREVGALLHDLSPQGLALVLDRLRAVMTEGAVAERTQYLVEGLLAIRRKGFVEAG
jgi:pre-mRNA-splicing factor CWC22